MSIKAKLVGGFVIIALMVAVVACFSVLLSGEIWKLRTIELPMLHDLSQVEESGWQAVYEADSFLFNADPRCAELFREQIAEAEESFGQYRALLETDEEKQLADTFLRNWTETKGAALELIGMTVLRKKAEDRLFEYVDKADDVIDFKIQAKFSPADPDILAKEQALREVEVSLWEAIHAATQYAGLNANIERAGHAQKTFAELMEKQFEDVDEFWSQYKTLATSDSEKAAIVEFESLWTQAVTQGRDVVRLENESSALSAVLHKKAEELDEFSDSKMRTLIQERIAVRDRDAKSIRAVTIAVSVIGLVAAVVIGWRITRTVCSPVLALQKATTELAAGNLAYRMDMARSDEFGQMAAAFDQMAGTLERTLTSKESLEEANRHLRVEMNERKRAVASNRELTQLTESLEAANRELRDFVYAASHDLREPLRKVSCFGALLQESLGDSLGGDDLENLDFMIDGARRMSDMIDGLLQYSRLNTTEESSSDTNLNEVIEDLEKLELSVAMEEAGARIVVDKELPHVFADGLQMRQLLQNLIGNAIKYRRSDEEPIIEIRSGASEAGWVRIEVADNGIGISEEYRKGVFKMFKRLHSRNAYDGTGIGLAICRRITDRHCGRIGVEANEPHGSVFWFTMPAVESVTQEKGMPVGAA